MVIAGIAEAHLKWIWGQKDVMKLPRNKPQKNKQKKNLMEFRVKDADNNAFKN